MPWMYAPKLGKKESNDQERWSISKEAPIQTHHYTQGGLVCHAIFIMPSPEGSRASKGKLHLTNHLPARAQREMCNCAVSQRGG